MPKILPRIAEVILDAAPRSRHLPPSSRKGEAQHKPQPSIPSDLSRRKPVPLDCHSLPWGKRPAPRSPSPKPKELTPPSYHRKRRLPDALVSQPPPSSLPLKDNGAPAPEKPQSTMRPPKTEENRGRESGRGLPAIPNIRISRDDRTENKS